MVNQAKKVVLVLLFSLPGMHTFAQKTLDMDWSEARFFASDLQFANKSPEIKALLATDQVPELNSAFGFGIEVNAKWKSGLKVGTRIKGIFTGSNKKDAPLPASAYYSIQQYTASLNLRWPFVNQDTYFADIFAELGLGNNTVSVKTSAGTGEWKKDAHFMQRAGLSLGGGSKDIKFYVEGGFEWNKINNPDFQGTLPDPQVGIDLSGSYGALGLVISGLPSWIKVGK
jgi:hypothetical protein